MTLSAKDFMKSEVAKLLDTANEIVDAANADVRDLTEEEQKRVKDLTTKVNEYKSQIQKIEDNEELRAGIERMNGSFQKDEAEEVSEAKTLGEAFIKSQAYQTFKSGTRGGNWTTGPVELGAKATMTEAASVIVQPDVQPGLRLIGQRRLVVADLMAPGTTSSNSVRYLVETTATNAAAAVAEGADKPESTLVLDEVDEPVRKIATVLPVSDEMLEDEAQIRSYIDARLRLFVELEEDEQLLLGDGTAPNISGILDRVGIQTATRSALATASGAATPTQADAIYQAITNIRVNSLGSEPDGVVFHPTDWAEVRLLKDGNLQYFGGGPFTAAYGNSGGITVESIWGLNVVITPVLTANTVVVGAFRTQSQVFRKGGITVEASNSHNDYFIKNLTAIRAEERLALAVYRPAAFHAITAFSTP